MSELLKNIDERSKLAGTNKLEILTFSLGRDMRSGREEIFGINVFKVREVKRIPEITQAPGMPPSVEGMVNLRGELVPIIDLAKFINITSETPPGVMIVAEYNGHTQGFLVKSVDTILRLDWAAMHAPPPMLMSKMGGLVTAVSELKNGRLVMMLDVEKILAQSGSFDINEQIYVSVAPLEKGNRTVFFADDSSSARNHISRTLDAMKVKSISAINGREAWEELQKLADYAEASRQPLKQLVQVILTDVEMPEMDGYTLTRNIKSDSRFKDIPVLMHSSLSSESNTQLGKSVGVDEYVPKSDPQQLSKIMARLLN